jgi:hypothetical protein
MHSPLRPCSELISNQKPNEIFAQFDLACYIIYVLDGVVPNPADLDKIRLIRLARIFDATKQKAKLKLKNRIPKLQG